MAMKLIDVSSWNGKINWEEVKKHIDGAILRCGFGSDFTHQDDKYFKYNADECTRLGIPFGVYLYSYAKTDEQAKSEAAHVLRLIKGYKLSYPVYYDLEEPGTENGAAARAVIFGDIIEAAGYWCGVYASTYWWDKHLVGLERFTKWVAQWSKTCQYTGKYLDIWQYTDSGMVHGIDGHVDMNECYRDFPAEIIGTTVPAAPVKTTYELALEVLEGLWGNGAERKELLGDRYKEVQDEVNRILAEREDAELTKVAKAVIRGDYGNGRARFAKLEAEGYNAKKVQDRVNELLGIK